MQTTPSNRTSLVAFVRFSLIYGLLSLTVLFTGTLAQIACKPRVHSVTLTWVATVDSAGRPVDHYNVYRSAIDCDQQAACHWEKIGESEVTTYTDNSVRAHETWFYTTSGVDAAGHESMPSKSIRVEVPR